MACTKNSRKTTLLAHKPFIYLVILCLLALFTCDAIAQEGDSVRGKALFQKYGCAGCHSVRAAENKLCGPNLTGIFGKLAKLSDGSSVTINDQYLLKSITAPTAHVCVNKHTGKAYADNLMPERFKHLPERDLLDLVAYIKTLSGVTSVPSSEQPTAEQPTAEQPSVPADGEPVAGYAIEVPTAVWSMALIAIILYALSSPTRRVKCSNEN